ncbi:MAG: ornithine carbamoyltransferase, partial [Candidatus Subteraquimicrobiales bacterium]|nr:ornithine carbamoyltransferase [Candidatus Subteraquimicrobiales bacterium]
RVLSKAIELKKLLRQSIPHRLLEGKAIALIFAKPSTRTRVSFEAGIAHLGAHPICLDPSDLQLGRGETISDTGKVLSRYVDAIVIRTYLQKEVEELAEAADVPVINGLTNDFHPCQALADLLTILEKKERLSGLKIVYVGDGNNVANSLVIASAKMGMNIHLASPMGYEVKEEVLELARKELRNPKQMICLTNDPFTAMKNADVIYTDVWTSMGNENEGLKRKKVFKDYQVNTKLVSYAKNNCIVMHCLPAHRGEEITDEVMADSKCVVFDQAENRLHTQKALLTLLLSGS